MPKSIDLTGKRFNKLIVLKNTNEREKNGSIIWECRCDCGNIVKLSTSEIKRSNRKSCGCLNKMDNLEKRKFGRIQVVKFLYFDKNQHSPFYLCKCDCGKEKIINGYSLKHGKTQSCGCISKEIQHNKKTIFEEDKRLYGIWSGIKSRCNNPNTTCSKYYYQKNITICDEWLVWSNFKKWALANGYNDTLTIDRINNKGNYEPSNCRWVNYEEQANNTSNIKLLTFNNITLSLSQWSRKLNIKEPTLSARLKRGWSVEKALTTPPQKNLEKD